MKRKELTKKILSSRWDSNPQPTVHWPDAVTTELPGTLVVSSGDCGLTLLCDTTTALRKSRYVNEHTQLTASCSQAE